MVVVLSMALLPDDDAAVVPVRERTSRRITAPSRPPRRILLLTNHPHRIHLKFAATRGRIHPRRSLMETLLSRHWHHMTADDAASLLASSAVKGLHPLEAKDRLEHFGPNVITTKKKRNPLLLLLLQFHQPLVYILIAAGTVTRSGRAGRLSRHRRGRAPERGHRLRAGAESGAGHSPPRSHHHGTTVMRDGAQSRVPSGTGARRLGGPVRRQGAGRPAPGERARAPGGRVGAHRRIGAGRQGSGPPARVHHPAGAAQHGLRRHPCHVRAGDRPGDRDRRRHRDRAHLGHDRVGRYTADEPDAEDGLLQPDTAHRHPRSRRLHVRGRHPPGRARAPDVHGSCRAGRRCHTGGPARGAHDPLPSR